MRSAQPIFAKSAARRAGPVHHTASRFIEELFTRRRGTSAVRFGVLTNIAERASNTCVMDAIGLVAFVIRRVTPAHQSHEHVTPAL